MSAMHDMSTGMHESLMTMHNNVQYIKGIKGESKLCNARLYYALKSNHDTRQCLTTLYYA
eukprot:3303414-Rhodomonas_salina.1